MSGTTSPVKTIDAVPAPLKENIDRWIASQLKFDAARLNAVLLRHKAVIAGSFCITPVAAFLRSPVVSFSPSDVDIWVASEQAQGLVSDLTAMFRGSSSWFSKNSSPAEVRKQNFELSQYRRLREDVEAIYVITLQSSQVHQVRF